MTNGRVIYMDNHATTPVDPRVLKAMMPYFVEFYGNAASVDHTYGADAAEAVARARAKVGSAIEADPEEIIFTSGATESNNLALVGAVGGSRKKGKHIVTCATEHKAVIDTCRYLEACGYRVTYLPVDSRGMIDLDHLRRAITAETIVVSLMAANNEVGVVHPLAEIGQITRSQGVIFHTDATQAMSYVPIDVNAMNIDLLSLSGHKIYGPKGIGALFVRQKRYRVRLCPILHGGGHERGMRSGTLNVPAIVGLGAATRLSQDVMRLESNRVSRLRDILWEGVIGSFPNATLHGHPTRRLPNNLNFAIPGIESRSLIIATKRIVAMSTGAACTTTTVQPSHVLTAMKVPVEHIHCTLRFGLGRLTTCDQVETVVDALRAAGKRILAMKPL